MVTVMMMPILAVVTDLLMCDIAIYFGRFSGVSNASGRTLWLDCRAGYRRDHGGVQLRVDEGGYEGRRRKSRNCLGGNLKKERGISNRKHRTLTLK